MVNCVKIPQYELFDEFDKKHLLKLFVFVFI